MTDKQLEEFGFYRNGNYILQISNYECTMDLGWFGVRVDNFKELKVIEFIQMIYKAGEKKGYKEGQNNIRHAINDILKIEE